MRNFLRKKTILSSIEEQIEDKPEYQKMLNNLLGINNRDNATLASSRTSNFDLSKFVSEEDFNKIFENRSFSVYVDDVDGDGIAKDLSKAKDFQEFTEVVEENGLFFSITDRKKLQKSFRLNKEEIIEKILKQESQKVTRWKKLKNKYLDQQVQSNSWPLYVGTMFVKMQNESSCIYGPLILKKVEIEITKNNQVKINTLDESVDINEKLIFLLQNETSFSLPTLDEEYNYSFNEIFKIFAETLENVITPKKMDFKKPFKHLGRNEIKNTKLEYAPGAALSLVSPSGGKLRDKLIELVKNNQIEDLLDFDILRDVKKEVDQAVEEGESIFRITATDLSQEKAVIGSLKDSAIIWGPPGTGKSQTIANILANLLYQDQRVIVTSEKKAALDVIQSRMGTLSKFMFFGLTDKNVNKKQFYRPFNELAKVIKQDNVFTEQLSTSAIPEEHVEYMEQKRYLKNEDISSLSYVYNEINNKYPKFWKKIKKFYKSVNKLPQVITNLQIDGNIFQILKKENIRKKGIFRQYPKHARRIIKMMKVTQGDIEFLKSLKAIHDIKNIFRIDQFRKTEINYCLQRSQFSSDEQYLEAVLTKRFREKVIKLRRDPILGKRINTFIKNSASGFRIPYKFVNIYKDIIDKLFSVFISTPQTLADTIDMKAEYDYAIFDEASQLHLEKALPFIALAKKSIVAGDHQQMRPSSWMAVRDRTVLESDNEENVDSLLDYAYRKGLKDSREYMLTKNYRSSFAQLMAFSAKHFYESKLDVVDSCSSIGNHQPIEVYNVNGKWEGRVNQKEAVAALDKLLEIQDEYPKIILLTLNASQKHFFESLIYNKRKYVDIIDMLKEEKVVLRNLENIQGDEADLVIVSVAYDKNAHLGTTYVARPEGKNSLNVAISRAREKMIIFKSIKSEEVEVQPNNESMALFRDWLIYLDLTKEKQRSYTLSKDEQGEDDNTKFQEEVFHYIQKNLEVKKNVYIATQYQIGSYKIDQALINSENNKFICGIEISDYNHNNKFQDMTNNLERQMFLNAKGYPIYRITELNWKTKTNQVIKEIQKIVNR